MPYYVYTHEKTGNSIERVFRMGMAPETVKFEGKTFTRDIRAEWAHRTDRKNRGWPLVSEFGGVHPDQVPEVQEYVAARGAPTEFNAEGDAILRDRAHRKAYLKARDMVDLDGGYGD